MKFRYRIKVRALGREWVWQWGDPDSAKVILQVAVTIPIVVGFDFEIFA